MFPEDTGNYAAVVRLRRISRQCGIRIAASISNDGRRTALAVLNHDTGRNLSLGWSVEGNTDARPFEATQWTSYTASSNTEPNSINRNLISESTRQFPKGTRLNEIVLPPASLNFILLLSDTADR